MCVARTLGTKNKSRNKQNVGGGGHGTVIYVIAEVYRECSTSAWDLEQLGGWRAVQGASYSLVVGSYCFVSLRSTGHCMYRTVVTICTVSLTFTILRSAHTVYLCVLCGSQNKQRLFPYTALTDWFICSVAKLRKPTISFVISVHTSVRPSSWNNSAQT